MSEDRQPKMFSKIIQFGFKPDDNALYVLDDNGGLYRRNVIGSTFLWTRCILPEDE